MCSSMEIWQAKYAFLIEKHCAVSWVWETHYMYWLLKIPWTSSRVHYYLMLTLMASLRFCSAAVCASLRRSLYVMARLLSLSSSSENITTTETLSLIQIINISEGQFHYYYLVNQTRWPYKPPKLLKGNSWMRVDISQFTKSQLKCFGHSSCCCYIVCKHMVSRQKWSRCC